jgi:hypothetical protein
LGVDPGDAFDIGEKIGGPQGPRTHSSTVWCAERKVLGERFFVKEVLRLVEWLEKRKEFVATLTNGGEVRINVQLAGGANIGDTLRADTLERIAALRVCLGVEVFPNLT